jgi:hypothetical protein
VAIKEMAWAKDVWVETLVGGCEGCCACKQLPCKMLYGRELLEGM